MSPLRRLLFIVLLGLVGQAAAEDVADSPFLPAYRLGQGLSLPQRGLDIGGYLSLQYDAIRHQTPVLSLQDLSLFVTKRLGGRWSLFTELELGDALKVSEDGHAKHEPELDIERLYAEYRIDPAATLRLGKFLTPVGQWNMIHADPLVWTVSRPLTATAAFARHSTGAMLYGSLPTGGHDLDYWLFADDTAQLDPLQRDENAFDLPGATETLDNNFDRALGGRLLYHSIDSRLSLGLSYVYAELQGEQDDKNLIGADFEWTSSHVILSGEAIYRTSSGWTEPDERGGFIQAVVPLPGRLYLIGRYEDYRAKVLTPDPTITTLGLTYRPRPPVSLKLEYRLGSGNAAVAPDGWLASLAILF